MEAHERRLPPPVDTQPRFGSKGSKRACRVRTVNFSLSSDERSVAWIRQGCAKQWESSIVQPNTADQGRRQDKQATPNERGFC